MIGAGSVIVTTGDGIGLRSGGFEPSRIPPAPQGNASAWVELAASILSVLRRSGRRVRPLPGRRGAQPSLRPRGSFRLDRSAPAHPSACLGLDRSGSGRVAVFTHNRPARGVEAGGAIIASPGPSVGVMAPAGSRRVV